MNRQEAREWSFTFSTQPPAIIPSCVTFDSIDMNYRAVHHAAYNAVPHGEAPELSKYS